MKISNETMALALEVDAEEVHSHSSRIANSMRRAAKRIRALEYALHRTAYHRDGLGQKTIDTMMDEEALIVIGVLAGHIEEDERM